MTTPPNSGTLTVRISPASAGRKKARTHERRSFFGNGSKTPADGGQRLPGLLFLFQRAVSGAAGSGGGGAGAVGRQRRGRHNPRRCRPGAGTAYHGSGHHLIFWHPARGGAAGNRPRSLRQQGPGRVVQYPFQLGKRRGGAGQRVPAGTRKNQAGQAGAKAASPVQGHWLHGRTGKAPPL